LRLLLRAVTAAVAVRLCLWLLPSRILMCYVARRAERCGEARVTGRTAARIAWAVARVSRRIPHATCLVRALTAQLLLAKYGFPSELRVGVSKTDGSGLLAHAWLESGGLVVLGGDDLPRYTPLPELGPALFPQAGGVK
jgi:hypothetical protein